MGHGSRLVTKVCSQSRVNEKTVDACHLRARTFTLEADSVTLTCEQASAPELAFSRLASVPLSGLSKIENRNYRSPLSQGCDWLRRDRLSIIRLSRKPTVLASRTNRARFRGADLGGV